jgi:uncharacterized protein (TIGR03437 family)
MRDSSAVNALNNRSELNYFFGHDRGPSADSCAQETNLKPIRMIFPYFAAAICAALPLAAQNKPTVRSNGVVNAASFAGPGMPNFAIAQGSIFNVFGSGLGPAALVQSSGFPVPTSLAGTSMTVTVGGTTVKPLILYTSDGQIAAVMPSATPTGLAMLVVTYNGQASAQALFQIVPSSFGVFTLNSAGTGPGIITDASKKVNGIDTVVTKTTAMNPGDVGIIWGTGLGPVSGDESAGALPADQPSIPVEVYVGGLPAALTYRGRSGCCSGLDQIAFVVPKGISGCNIPVEVKIGDVVSNFPSIAVAPTGNVCTDANSLSAEDQTRLSTVGSVSVGSLTLTRTNITLPLPPPLPTVNNTSDIGAGLFEKFTYAQYQTFQNPTNYTLPGTCTVFDYTGTTATYIDPIQPTLLDAGTSLTVMGPNGMASLIKGSTTGLQYSKTLGNVTTGLPVATPLYLDKGDYTVTGPGGAGVGGFKASITLPDPLVWTNEASTSTVTRSLGQTVNWTGGDPSGNVLILGFSTVRGANAGREFLCVAPTSAGTFTIPPPVLLALPASTSTGIPTSAAAVSGALGVGYTKTNSFTAPGIDFGTIVGLNLNLTIVSYK